MVVNQALNTAVITRSLVAIITRLIAGFSERFVRANQPIATARRAAMRRHQ